MRRDGCLPLLLATLAPGCGSEGKGTVVVTAYGESFIEDGIPASEVDDGWAIAFGRFEVSIRNVEVAGTSISVPATIDVSVSSSGAGHELGSALVPEGNHTGAGFSIARVEVDGSATKGANTKTFSWVFDQATDYSECDTTTSVPDGGVALFEITIHADHLLYDSLVAEDPQLLFGALADADTDADGEITRVELAATDIGAYDAGSEGGVDDLWSWLVVQTRTLGHVDGEGHCVAVPSST